MISVIPEHDKYEHKHEVYCGCDPNVEWVDEDTGLPYPRGPLVLHNLFSFYEGLTKSRWAVYED